MFFQDFGRGFTLSLILKSIGHMMILVSALISDLIITCQWHKLLSKINLNKIHILNFSVVHYEKICFMEKILETFEQLL